MSAVHQKLQSLDERSMQVDNNRLAGADDPLVMHFDFHLNGNAAAAARSSTLLAFE